MARQLSCPVYYYTYLHNVTTDDDGSCQLKHTNTSSLYSQYAGSMPARKDIWKFTNSITKFINKQWSKLKTSSDDTDSLKSSGILDRLLQDEYASLIQEINTFDTEKRCFLCFKNEKFSVQSSRDLTKILEKHSEEVLKHFIAEHNTNVKGNGCARTGSDLVNYVTKVVVSRPKCNRKICNHNTPQNLPKGEGEKKCNGTICDCKRPSGLKPPQKIPKRASVEPKNSTKPQKAVSTETTAPKPIETQTSEIPITKIEQLDTEAQTDPWDPNCSCGSCPKTEPEVNEMNVATEEQNLQDTSTSHAVLTDSKSVSVERQGESIEVQTSINKICVPEYFQSLLKANIMINTCPNKADCGCDVYGSTEKICIQTQKAQDPLINMKPTETEESFSSHNVKHVPVTTIKEDRSKRDSIALTKTPYVYEYEITPKSKVKKEKKKKKTTGCFGSKKKNKGCSEECQGINNKPRSMQTEKVKTVDKNEEAHLHTDKRTNQTSTDSEAAIQVTDLTSSVHHNRKPVKENNNSRHVGEEEPHKTAVCDKCGRQKKSCDTGCRNMIILPQVSKSGQAILNRETESLRKLLKMQHEDTNRQFDNIMAKLTRHSSEITRLNDAYQNLVRQGLDDSHQSAVISNKKKESELSRYKCGCSLKFDQLRSCGCKYSNECRTNESTSRIINIQNGSVMDNIRSKRYGPPNTAVAINMCNLRASQIVSTITADNALVEYHHLEEKQRKELLNQSKRSAINTVQNGALRDNDPRARGDSCQFQISSVSTIYQENQYNQRESPTSRKRNSSDDVPDTDSSLKKESSRVQVWLKKSWITVKQKNDEQQKNTPVAQMFNLCQNAAKKVVTGAWKYVKKT